MHTIWPFPPPDLSLSPLCRCVLALRKKPRKCGTAERSGVRCHTRNPARRLQSAKHHAVARRRQNSAQNSAPPAAPEAPPRRRRRREGRGGERGGSGPVVPAPGARRLPSPRGLPALLRPGPGLPPPHAGGEPRRPAPDRAPAPRPRRRRSSSRSRSRSSSSSNCICICRSRSS